MKTKYIWEESDLKGIVGKYVMIQPEYPNITRVFQIGFTHIGTQQYYTKTNILTDGWTYHFPTTRQLFDWLNSSNGAQPLSWEEVILLTNEKKSFDERNKK